MPGFPGFSKEFVSFFRGLKRNNSRPYFESKREVYQNLVKPTMAAFVLAIGKRLEKISPYFVAEPATSIYRIYRDIRFSKNKLPYKTHAAALFYHRYGSKHEYPAFYFQIDPERVMLAGGHYAVPPEQLERIRQAIDRNGQLLAAILKTRSFKNRFGEVNGESLKRPPRGYSDDHPFIDLLKLKQYLVYEEFPTREIIDDPIIVKRTIDSYRAASPLLQFLCAAVNIPF